MAKLNIDPETGEIIPANVMVPAASLPSIIIDISDVQKYHKEPEKLVEIISNQAGYAVFDVSHGKGRDECRSHAANIIRCISPAINASKAMAEDAKKVVKQDLEFRNKFEAGIRELAAYHRKPLTEWEEEQSRIKEAARLEELKRFEEEHYLLDWQDAIDFDELYTLRKEKEAEQKRAAEAQREADEQARIEREVVERLEAERQRIRQEEEAKARQEAEAKIRAEQEAERLRIQEEERLAKLKEDSQVRWQAPTVVPVLKQEEKSISEPEWPVAVKLPLVPTDLEIVQVIAAHYRVPAATALEWVSWIDAADVARKIVGWKLL